MNNNQAKLLNLIVAQENFVNKNTEEYLYASLSQPPIKIVDKNNSDESIVLNAIHQCLTTEKYKLNEIIDYINRKEDK